MRGRFASAILRQMGLDEWVAGSVAQYIALVEQLALDSGLRARVKTQLRDRQSNLYGDQETVAVLGKHLLRLCSHRTG